MWNLIIVMAAFTHSGAHKPETLWYSPTMTNVGTFLGKDDTECMAAAKAFIDAIKAKTPGFITGPGGDQITDLRMIPQCIKVDLPANVLQKAAP